MTTILIVEANDAGRDALARQLEGRNYSVLTAADGRDGMSRARELQPDLILMDLGVPGMDGWEATAQLKTDPETRHIPIIVLSAQTRPNDRHQALAAGGDDFDSKPVQFDRLLEKIEVLIAMGRGGGFPDAQI